MAINNYGEWDICNDWILKDNISLSDQDNDLINSFVELQWKKGKEWMMEREPYKSEDLHKTQIRRGKAAEFALLSLLKNRKSQSVIYDYDNSTFKAKHAPDVIVLQGNHKINFHVKCTRENNPFHNWRFRNSDPIVMNPKNRNATYKGKAVIEIDMVVLAIDSSDIFSILHPFQARFLNANIKTPPSILHWKDGRDGSRFLNLPELECIYKKTLKK